MLDWEYRGPLYVGNEAKYPKTGRVWELPVFLPLGRDSKEVQKHIFLINPAFLGYSPHTVKYVWYWIGVWDRDNYRFLPDQEEPQRFDYGEHFTGQSGMIDEHGRAIIFSIAQDRRTGAQHYAAGWAHNAGLPIILTLRDDDRLGVEPIPELAALRGHKLVAITEEPLERANLKLAEIGGDMLEIVLELQWVTADRFGIKVRCSPDAAEETLIYYDAHHQTINVDRERSSLDFDVVGKGVQGGPLVLNDENLKLHVFLDRSMIEVYANGLKRLTSRVYPSRPDALGLRLWGNGDVVVKQLGVWEMDSAYNH